MRRSLVILGAVSAIAPGAARAAVPIQPGMLIRIGQTQCTAGFVFDGTRSQAGRVYVSTASHCVQAKGQAVLDAEGAAIGTVVAHGSAASNESDDHNDWALFEVPAAQVGRIDPSLAGHPDLPRGGIADPAHVVAGDQVQFSGQGQPWVTPYLQQKRTGALVTYAEPRYAARGPVYFGDSGGPVVDIASGRAVGIVALTTVVGPGPTLYETSGPTPGAIAAQAGAAGIHVALRTVEQGKGSLEAAPIGTTRTSRPKAPTIKLTVDYLLARRAIRLGGRRLLVSAWLRGRRLELTLARGGKVIGRAHKTLRSVPAQAGLAIAAPRGRLTAHGVLRYGSKRVRFRVSSRRIAFVR